MGIFHGTGIPVIPARREIPEAREFPGNSRTGNSREGKVWASRIPEVREFPGAREIPVPQEIPIFSRP